MSPYWARPKYFVGENYYRLPIRSQDPGVRSREPRPWSQNPRTTGARGHDPTGYSVYFSYSKFIVVILAYYFHCSYYGCGLAVPEALAGCRVLHLGCGVSRDCYILSQMVGQRGRVVGLDPSQEVVGQ